MTASLLLWKGGGGLREGKPERRVQSGEMVREDEVDERPSSLYHSKGCA